MSDKLAKVCPVCKAAPGGKCLDTNQPHKERWYEKLEDAVGTAIGEAKFGQ